MKVRFAVYALLSIIPAFAGAKTVDFLGITNDGQRASIKARLNTDGKTVASVRTFSYNMTDGYPVVNTAYDILQDDQDTFLSADVAYYPDNDGYTYRVELTFADGSTYTSEVVNLDLTKAFMWLGDYQYAEGKSGWDDQHPPVVDREIDPSLTLTLDGRVYYKAVSNHAPGYLLYKFEDAPFSRFVSRIGVQDDRTDGDVTFKFYSSDNISNTTENSMKSLLSQTMYSKSNTQRGDNPCIKDVELDITGTKVFRIQLDQFDNNWGDHAHLALARLYFPDEDRPVKTVQQVTFTTEGGDLEGAVNLNATATSGGNVYYRIISGRELATINNGVLTPVWGAKGIVVVEATQYGDNNYYPCSAYLTFNVDMAPRIQMLSLYQPTLTQAGNTAYAYLLVDTKGKNLDKLTVDVFSDPDRRVKEKTVDVLPQFFPSKGAHALEIPVDNYSKQVFKVAYSFSDNAAVDSLAYWHPEGSYDYASDLPTSAYTYGLGYPGTFAANHPYNNMNSDRLEIGTGSVSHGVFAKGFGVHASGYVEIQARALAPYSRFVGSAGPQKNGTNNYQNQKLTLRLTNGNITLADTTDMLKTGIIHWDYPINNQAPLRLVGDQGSDGNGNDYVCFGAPRLYYINSVKTPQTISWDTEKRIINNTATSIPLDAEATSGFPIFYHIVKGAQYATISDGKLVISNLPVGGDEIVVNAVQPGSDVWADAPTATCTFRLTHGLEVQRNEYVELKDADVLDELIIHADKMSSGQVALKNSVVDVRKLIIKYTFIPDEWVHIAFPSDLDIDKISNLGALGYGYNAFGNPAYYIKELDTEARASGGEGWKMLESPNVKANKGYLMSIDSRITDQPVEVTFTIDNAAVDLKDFTRSLGLTVDFSGMEPGKTQNITVTSADPSVPSNNLTVEVTFSPTDLASLPINHQKALENMRFVFVPGHKAIRLTLPDPTPARVVFFDSEGKHVIKAVRYIAPNVIDLSGMKSGRYNMVVNYGNASQTYPIDL